MYAYWFPYLSFWFCLLPLWSVAQPQASDSSSGHYELQIKRAEDKIVIDGKLEESSWQTADITSDFWMCFPVDGRKTDADIQTAVRLTYDDQFIYIGAICYGSTDYQIPTLKRDSRDIWQGDIFSVLLDPIHEASNGFNFGVNPAGVQIESLISGRTGTRAEIAAGRSSRGINTAWDNKWFAEVGTEEGRWVVEMAIPFKTLRFDPTKTDWGINFSRGEPRSNSWNAWSPVPVQFLTLDLGYTGTLTWDQPPAKVKSNISVIPYTLGSYSRDYEDGTPTDWDLRAGVDAKVAITSGLNLDLTINPDFSQVEVDEQVTNLSTFNVRFPERRLFFLENSDVFSDFGIPPMRPFFSRRIGLDEEGNTIPILYGARLSGNLSPDMRIGAMNMQTQKTDDLSVQNYSSFALQQRVLKRSLIKGYLHNRQAMANGKFADNDYNRTLGAEFSYFSQDAKWRGFGGYGISLSDDVKGDNYYYNVGLGYDTRNIGFYSNVSGLGNNYYADMGWIPFADHYDAVRDTSIHVGFHHVFSRFSYTFYPKKQEKVNSHQLNVSYLLDLQSQGLNLLQSRINPAYILTFANTAAISLEYRSLQNELLFPFDFTDDEPLPAGRYRHGYGSAEYKSDVRKFFSWQGGLEYGSFFSGTRIGTSLNLRYRVQPWGNFGINFVYNRLEFPDPYGQENLLLIGPRFEVNFSRNVFWTTFLQYNTQKDNFNINSRLQWRFQPMSDLFIVYTDNYAIEYWGKKNRALVLKMNYWLNL